MEHRIWKHWPFMIVMAIMGFSFYALKLAMSRSNAAQANEPISYEMPRPAAAEMAYDLSRRQVVRNIRSLVNPGNAVTADTAISTTRPPMAYRNNVDPRKAHAAAAKKRASEDAAKRAALARKKAKMSVQLAEQENRRMKALDSKPASTSTALEPMVTSGAYTETPVNPVDQSDEEKVRKLSASEWHDLLLKNPTAKTAADFADAFRKGQIDEKSFYEISRELLADPSEERQKLALVILARVSSVKTFTLLTEFYQEKTPEALRTSIYGILKTYGEPAKFSILAKLLESKQPRVALLASQILEKTVAAQNITTQNNDGRDIRRPGSTIPASQFQTFLPALERLSSGGGDLAQQAQSLLAQIQALQSV